MKVKAFLTEHERFESLERDEVQNIYRFRGDDENFLYLMEDRWSYHVRYDSNIEFLAENPPKWFRDLRARMQLAVLEEEKMKAMLKNDYKRVLKTFKPLYIKAKSELENKDKDLIEKEFEEEFGVN